VLSSCASIPIDETIEKPNTARIQELSPLVSLGTIGAIQSAHGFSRSPQEFKENLSIQLGKFLPVRKPLFVELMRKDPNAALASVIPQSTLQTLSTIPSLPFNCAETFTTIEGTLEILHRDFFEEGIGVERYTLTTNDNQRISLHPAQSTSQLPISGIKLRIKGYRLDNDFIFDGGNTTDINILPSTKSSSSNLFIKEVHADHIDWHTQLQQDARGEQKTVVLMVDPNDTSPPTWTNRDAIRDLVFTQMKNYYIENSYGKITNISGDVFPASGGWYEMDISSTCSDIKGPAIRAADADVNFANYSRVIIVAPNMQCGGGEASIGKVPHTTGEGIVSISVSRIYSVSMGVFTHEFGHNLGSGHASFFDCLDLTIAVDLADCKRFEYRDWYDAMGNGFVGHFNAPHKEYLGWLDVSNIQTATSDSSFAIEPIETATTGLKAVKILRRPSFFYGEPYWQFLTIEYRQPIGFDSVFPSMPVANVFLGGLLHAPLLPWTSLFDPTPPRYPYYSALLVGESFTDFRNGVTITSKQRTEGVDGKLSLDVKFNTLDLVTDAIGLSPTNPVAGNPLIFSGTIKNRGTGTLELKNQASLRVDVGNDGSWDIRPPLPANVPVDPLGGGTSKTVSWPQDSWKWLANGNSTVDGTMPWTAISTVPSSATKLGIAVWAIFDANATLSGNQENFTVALSDSSCTRSKAPWPDKTDNKGGCLVIQDLTSDRLYDDNYPFQNPGDPLENYVMAACDLRYTASSRLVEFRDTSSSMDCGFAVFDYKTLLIASSGTHKIEICADAVDHIAESSETNNCKTQVFTVPSSDLVPDSLSISPAAPLDGSSLSSSVVIRNAGLGNLNAATSARLRLDVDNDGTWDLEPVNQTVGSIASGSTATVTWSGFWQAVKGTHKLEVCADSPDDLIEQDETNNCKSQVFKVSEWQLRANTPTAVSLGGSLAYPGSGNFLYALKGGNTTSFWRYSISDNSWQSLATTPTAVDRGGSLISTGGDFLYALRGNSTNDFWRYSISSNVWIPRSSPIYGNPADDGAALVYGGGDYLYAFKGGNNTFIRYSISQNIWTLMQAAPGTTAAGASLL
ncbi:MAG: CARDB domain-containing protein, partial [Nanoarchaeota archaeon]